MPPAISLCIPVYGTEEKLLSCLQSVANQQGLEADGLEIIVVNDASPLPPADTGIDSCSAIISEFQKTCPYPVLYLEHQENQGLVEARRTAVEAASGDYIFCLDSDDSIPSRALSVLYKYAKEDDLDIVQGRGQVLIAAEGCQLEGDSLAKIVKHNTEKAENVFLGKLKGPDILQSTLVKKEHNSFLWGKLIRRKLYLRALEQIPSMYCTMAEDLVQYILITHGACSYRGIPDIVYNYSVNTGISSHSTISTMERWEQVCSTASVFTVLFACMDSAASSQPWAR